jgi:hypothetical protein
MSTPSNFSLHNNENFFNYIQCSINDILEKYHSLIIAYLNFIIDNIKLKNNTYITFVIIRGLYTISNVFHILLQYSKNIELAYYHSQKSFYFYVEFIGQITDEQNIFLKLTSYDATLFVYKKTIFEINADNRKNKIQGDELLKMDTLEQHRSILYSIIENVFYNTETNENNKNSLKEYILYIEKICEKIINPINYKKINFHLKHVKDLQDVQDVKTFFEKIDKTIKNI